MQYPTNMRSTDHEIKYCPDCGYSTEVQMWPGNNGLIEVRWCTWCGWLGPEDFRENPHNSHGMGYPAMAPVSGVDATVLDMIIFSAIP